MAASVHLADGNTLHVSESVAEIQDAIAGLDPVTTPMVPLTGLGPAGQPILVAATKITSIEDLG